MALNPIRARTTPFPAAPLDTADQITQLAKFPCTPADARAIANIICATSGAELQTLIAQLDQRSFTNTHNPSFEDVVYHKISDVTVRQKVLDHLAKNAGKREIGVVSDYDDTAVPQYDKRFGKTFPGVAQLYREIDDAYDGKSGDIHFVSARPGFTANAPRKELPAEEFPAASVEASDWGPYVSKFLWKFVTLQWGSFGQARRDATIEGKVRNIEHLLALNPGQKYVFFGDTVQWDPEVYAEIKKRHPDRVQAIMIHEVPGTDTSAARLQGMHVTTTAYQAAQELCAEGVINQAAVEHVQHAR